jgi:hypothetical protein
VVKIDREKWVELGERLARANLIEFVRMVNELLETLAIEEPRAAKRDVESFRRGLGCVPDFGK